MRHVLAAFAVLVVNASLLAAQTTCDPPQTPEQCLKQAFLDYCHYLKAPVSIGGAPQNPPPVGVCRASPSRDRQWIALTAFCAMLPPGVAAPGFCDLLDKAKRVGGVGFGPLATVYSHESRTWRPEHRLRSLAAWRYKTDVAGDPTVSLEEDERIFVIVEDTNPLLYAALAAKPTEKDTPEVEAIKQLVDQLGTALQGVLRTVGPAAAAAGVFDDLEKKVRAEISKLDQSVQNVACLVGLAAEQTSRAISVVQALESGEKHQYRLAPPTCSGPPSPPAFDFQGVEMSFGALLEQIGSSLAAVAPCRSMLEATANSLSADPKKIAQIFERYFKAKNDLAVTACPVESRLTQALTRLMKPYGSIIESVGAPSLANQSQTDEIKREMAVQHAGGLARLRSLIRLIERYEGILVQAKALAGKKDAIRKMVVQVQQFESRLHESRLGPVAECIDAAGAGTGDPCVTTGSLDPRFFLEPQVKRTRPTKIQEHSVTVKVDSPFAKQIAPERPQEATGAFKLDSVYRGIWGISASAIHTELKAPTFTALTDPDDDQKKIIGEGDRENRSGDVALMADYRLGRRLCRGIKGECGRWGDFVGIELGVGVRNEPAFFGGLSFRLGKYVRLGAGYTYQQVKELRDQMLGDPLDSKDDIKMRDTFDGDFYVSLSVTFNSISLFNAD